MKKWTCYPDSIPGTVHDHQVWLVETKVWAGEAKTRVEIVPNSVSVMAHVRHPLLTRTLDQPWKWTCYLDSIPGTVHDHQVWLAETKVWAGEAKTCVEIVPNSRSAMAHVRHPSSTRTLDWPWEWTCYPDSILVIVHDHQVWLAEIKVWAGEAKTRIKLVPTSISVRVMAHVCHPSSTRTLDRPWKCPCYPDSVPGTVHDHHAETKYNKAKFTIITPI